MTFIDLFCGCGGFTLGMQRAGFKCLAAIDFNEEAINTFKANFSKDTLALHKDLTKFTPDKLAARLGNCKVDVIVGGPPCQGFSTVRQVDSANHGSRVRRDKRRYLFRVFLDYVATFRPLIFVMENVLGIQSAAKGKFFTLVQAEARKLGYHVHSQVEEAWKLGAPQKRRRQLVIGVRNDVPGYFNAELKPSPRANASPALWDAIGDLPPLAAGEGSEEREYDFELRKDFLSKRTEVAKNYLNKILEITAAKKLTSHRARPHNDRDLRDFARLREGETADQAIARGEKMEFPYDRSVFLDRYTRQNREGLCSTIVAHLAKDGLMFIHPEQNRSLTPREAARIQTFPDWFQFPVARTHQFRIIGNAVPPLVAEAVGEAVRDFLTRATNTSKLTSGRPSLLPENNEQAVKWLKPLLDVADVAPRGLQKCKPAAFRKAWYSIAFLYGDLHPDAALDHGETISRSGAHYCVIPNLDPRLLAPRYERSGWPVVLAPIAREAWRRYRNGELKENDFYCSEAQKAGMLFRQPELRENIQDN